MAEIKGLTLKKIVNFKGHEGEPLQQGDIYLSGKKVGFYSDDAWGGEARIHFDKKETDGSVAEICKAYFTQHPEERWSYDTQFEGNDEARIDELFTALLELLDCEKEYKKMLKKGYGIFAVYKHEGYRVQMSGFKSLEYAKKHLLEEKKVENPKFYTRLDDFIIK